MRLIVTRPHEEAERTAVSLRALGHEVLIAPMLRIEAIDGVSIPATAFAALLVTSANAIRVVRTHAQKKSLAALPLFAVGAQTALAAREAGFADVESADGDGGDLAALVVSKLRGGNGTLLYLAGNDRARDLPGDLARHGLSVETLIVYRAEPASSFAQDVREPLGAGAVDGVLHYSRRTAQNFIDCAGRADLMEAVRSLTHYCLSPRVAEPLASGGFKAVRIAPRPDEGALLALLGSS